MPCLALPHFFTDFKILRLFHSPPRFLRGVFLYQVIAGGLLEGRAGGSAAAVACLHSFDTYQARFAASVLRFIELLLRLFNGTELLNIRRFFQYLDLFRSVLGERLLSRE